MLEGNSLEETLCQPLIGLYGAQAKLKPQPESEGFKKINLTTAPRGVRVFTSFSVLFSSYSIAISIRTNAKHFFFAKRNNQFQISPNIQKTLPQSRNKNYIINI